MRTYKEIKESRKLSPTERAKACAAKKDEAIYLSEVEQWDINRMW